ncbi:MAG TPA: hypothetical protein VK841_08540 [Polyangiaceae bacterium]|jgi:hypothetical protein|nr:hypothetical protein [Polyangiaceae bacterium]
MRRLRDQSDSSDAAVVRAAKLLSCASPLDAARFRNPRLPAGGTSRPRALPLRAAAVLAMGLGSFAASAGVLPQLHVWSVPWATAHATASPPAGGVPIALPPRPAPAGVATVVASPAGPAALASPEAGSSAPGMGGPVEARATALVSAPVRTPSRPVPSDGESSLMIDAVRALRRDRDPARALSLAEFAMDRYPHGAQIEEAVALGMEAANAAGDGAAARRLAERYLATFRTGHFADRAQQILSAPLR